MRTANSQDYPRTAHILKFCLIREGTDARFVLEPYEGPESLDCSVAPDLNPGLQIATNFCDARQITSENLTKLTPAADLFLSNVESARKSASRRICTIRVQLGPFRSIQKMAWVLSPAPCPY